MTKNFSQEIDVCAFSSLAEDVQPVEIDCCCQKLMSSVRVQPVQQIKEKTFFSPQFEASLAAASPQMTGVLLEQWVLLLVHKMCGSRLGFSGRSGNAALIARQRPILWLYVSLFLMLMKLCFRTSTCRFQEIFKTFSENPYIIKSRMRVKHF